MLKYDLWYHEKTGHEFTVVFEGKVKLNDRWEVSISYQRYSFNEKDDTETIFTRTKDDFIKNFKPKI